MRSNLNVILALTIATAAMLFLNRADAAEAKKPVAKTVETVAPAPKIKLTIGQALNILTAIKGLDGRTIIVKQNGQDAAIMQPWDFASGSLRLRILKNASALEPNVKLDEEARRKIVTEILAGMPEGTTDIKAGTPEYDRFFKQREQVLNEPAVGTENLYPIKVSELRLDRNEIPISVLSALEPILEMDIPL